MKSYNEVSLLVGEKQRYSKPIPHHAYGFKVKELMTKQRKYSRIAINHDNDASRFPVRCRLSMNYVSVIETHFIRLAVTEHHSVQHTHDTGLFIAVSMEFSMIQLASIKEPP